MKRSEKVYRNQVIITSIDEMIDENSVIRVIDAYVQSLDVERLGYHVYKNKTGRPAYDPKELIGLYLYSYMSKVMSSRMMEKQTYINLEIMWLLDGTHPDHSTIAAFRSKTNTFHDFTKTCMELGLIGGKLLAIDGTKIHAYNNKKRNHSAKSLKKKIESLDEQIAEYFAELDKNDSQSEKIQELETRKESYKEMLDELHNSDETQISVTDPDSRLMDNKKGGLDVAYNIQATVDSENGLVIDQYVINAPTDQGELSKAVSRAQGILCEKDLTVMADKGYYNGKDLEECFSLGVTPIVSRQDPPKREGMYSINDFIYNEADDSFTCPQKQQLTRISGENANKTVYANRNACKQCPYRTQCFKQGGKHKYKRIIKDKYFRTMYKADVLFDKAKEQYHLRQELSEPIFGTIKRQLGFPQLNVRTKLKVSGEVSLLFLGYNFKRVMNIIGKERLIGYFREHIRSVVCMIIAYLLKSCKPCSYQSIRNAKLGGFSTA